MNGNILTYVDKNGVCVYNTYDGLNRLVSTKNSKDNTEFKYTYDSAGQLISVNGTSYKYNRFGELVEKTENGHTQKYSYNALGNRQSYSLYNGNIREMQINYSYDIQGRLSNVSSQLGNQIYTYDNANRLLKASNTVSKISSEYSYYPSGNIKSLTQTNGLQVTDKVEYQYNRNGFRTSETGFETEKRYVYDAQNRLSTVIDNNLITSYRYDDFGNISSIQNTLNGFAEKTVYAYDKNNRLVSQTKNGITTEYKYDNQGNLVFDGEKVYRYNGFNKLTDIFGNNLNAVYTYDHTGLRTSKTVNGVYTGFVNDGQNVTAQYVDGRASYYYRGLQLIGYINSNNDICFYQFNAHGDVTSIYDSFGNQTRSYDYDAFGKQKNSPDDIYRHVADDNPFRYCGEYFDTETNLIYLRARYYNPEIQRFVAEDPIRDGFNWYVYGNNNPIVYIDPTGFIVTTWDTFYCTPKEIKALREKTRKWENGNDQEKAKAAESSRKIREQYLKENEVLYLDGTVEAVFSNNYVVDNTHELPAGINVNISFTRRYEEKTSIKLNSVSMKIYIDKGYEIENIVINTGQGSIFDKSSCENITTTKTSYTAKYNWGYVTDIMNDFATHLGTYVEIKLKNKKGKIETLEVEHTVYSSYHTYDGKMHREIDWGMQSLDFIGAGRGGMTYRQEK